jgi:hypothetical protein
LIDKEMLFDGEDIWHSQIGFVSALLCRIRRDGSIKVWFFPVFGVAGGDTTRGIASWRVEPLSTELGAGAFDLQAVDAIKSSKEFKAAVGAINPSLPVPIGDFSYYRARACKAWRAEGRWFFETPYPYPPDLQKAIDEQDRRSRGAKFRTRRRDIKVVSPFPPQAID